MELTKEYFDDRMTTLREDIKVNRHEILSIRDDMATKDDMKKLEGEIAEIRTEMNTKFDAVIEMLDVREKVEELQKQMYQVRQELKLG